MSRSLLSRSSRKPAPEREKRVRPAVLRAARSERKADLEIPVEEVPAAGHAHTIRRAWPTERIVSREEKRELILAHAMARAAKGVGGVWTYYIGIAASFLIVGTGWWFTVGTDLRQKLLIPSSEPGMVEQIQEQAQELEQRYALPDSRVLQVLPVAAPANTETSTTRATTDERP